MSLVQQSEGSALPGEPIIDFYDTMYDFGFLVPWHLFWDELPPFNPTLVR